MPPNAPAYVPMPARGGRSTGYKPLGVRGSANGYRPLRFRDLALPEGDLDDPVQAILDGLSWVETRGASDSYSKLGKVSPKTGDRAYGKYQFMGAYIPDWSQQYLGRRMTPEELLANPQAQEKLMRARAADLLKQHGNIYDVASVHFTGRPLAKAGNAADYTGTDNNTYQQLFREGIEHARGRAPLANNEEDEDDIEIPIGRGYTPIGERMT